MSENGFTNLIVLNFERLRTTEVDIDICKCKNKNINFLH